MVFLGLTFQASVSMPFHMLVSVCLVDLTIDLN